MSIISRMRKQTAVYWIPLDKLDSYGAPVLGSPVEISCRWQDSVQLFIAADGTEQTSNAKVFVDRDVVIGGVLMLGTLEDITDPIHPKENEGAYEIKQFMDMPNLKATEFLKTVIL